MTPSNKIGRLDRPDNDHTAHLFQNPILERISKTHFSIPIILFFIIGAISFYFAVRATDIKLGTGVLVFIAGLIGFTLLEYLMHKYFFHMEPDNLIKDKIQYHVHGVHHDYPKDKFRMAMPPFMSLAYALILYFIFTFLMGDYGLYFLPGFLLGYSVYSGVHYAVHALKPPNNFLKVLWINHAIHHYKNHDVAFGVSSPLWDYIFGTLPKKTEKHI